MRQRHLVRQLIGQKTPNVNCRIVCCQQKMSGPKHEVLVILLALVGSRGQGGQKREKFGTPERDLAVEGDADYTRIMTRIDASRDASDVAEGSDRCPHGPISEFPQFCLSLVSASDESDGVPEDDEAHRINVAVVRPVNSRVQIEADLSRLKIAASNRVYLKFKFCFT